MALYNSDVKGIVSPGKLQVVTWVLSFVFLILIFRLAYLQVIKGTYFRELSENNRIRLVYIPSPRGLIFDRNGVPLARNRPSFDIELVREDAPKPEKTLERLEQILGLEPKTLADSLSSGGVKRRKFEPILLLRDVSRDEAAKVIAHGFELPGVVVNASTAREYLDKGSSSHIVGYIREITQKQLDQPDFVKYRSGDLVGQAGVEAVWEPLLHGKHGVQEVIVNAMGTKLGESRYEAASPGYNITLTVDSDLQTVANAALGDRRGAVVGMDPRTGEVLVLVSHPTFDSNIFTRKLSGATWQKMTSGEDKPLNNRAVQGVYPPGSVFKIFMAVAALAEGVTTRNETIYCPGHFYVGKKRFLCHKHSGHGYVSLTEALAGSCDVYFYTIGLRLGVDRIHEYATKFGLGEKTGVELGDEPSGLVPSTEWKRKAFRNPEDQKWYTGETPSVVIGQGAVTTTPLQIARAVSTLVNGGKVLVPQVVKSIAAGDGSFFDDSFGSKVVEEDPIDPQIAKVVMKALEAVVNDKEGTGGRAKVSKELDIVVAGKTGTAQVFSMNAQGQLQEKGDHAWFAGYAPADKPEIVVAAIVENSGHGGSVAAPVVSAVLEKYFRKNEEKSNVN